MARNGAAVYPTRAGSHAREMCPSRQVNPRERGQNDVMSGHNRRSISSWPASLLPCLTLVALLAGGAMTTTTSDNSPVVEMTVTTGR